MIKMYPNFAARQWQRRKDKKINLVWAIDKVMGEDYCTVQWVDWRLEVTK